MFDQLFENSSLPVLQQVMSFSEQRQKVLANDVANIDTPGFRQSDLPVAEFTAALGEAIDRRQTSQRFQMQSTRHLEFDPTGRPEVVPVRNMNFYDAGNRSVDELMSEMGKNALWHNVATELFRQQAALLNTAIQERV